MKSVSQHITWTRSRLSSKLPFWSDRAQKADGVKSKEYKPNSIDSAVLKVSLTRLPF
ncbi:hypothetical protein [Nostoc sp.]|uniref:hypothetical protein n=1 Tax=Nostoc sp. TaxID=1180 RepID=UPI002FF5CFB6